jgi:hypothetical protein
VTQPPSQPQVVYVMGGPPFRCGRCGYQGHARTETHVSGGGWIVFVLMLFFCLLLSWIPLVAMRETSAVCPSCPARQSSAGKTILIVAACVFGAAVLVVVLAAVIGARAASRAPAVPRTATAVPVEPPRVEVPATTVKPPPIAPKPAPHPVPTATTARPPATSAPTTSRPRLVR